MRPTRAHAMFAVMCVMWGMTFIALKIGIAAVPPTLFAGARFVAAGLCLTGFTLLRYGARPPAAGLVPRLAVVTVLMIVLTYVPLYWGAQFVSSGLAAILDMATIPVTLLALGVVMGVERLSAARVAGTALGVAGLATLFGPKAVEDGGGGGDTSMALIGGVAIVLSAAAYSLGSVLARPLLRAHAPVEIAGMTTLGGGVLLVAGAWAWEPGAGAAMGLAWGRQVGWPVWAAWLFLVVGGSLLGYTIFLHLVREWGAARAGSYAFVSPIIAVLMGVAVFGETVSATEAAGMAMMLAAAFLTLRPAPAIA